MPRTARIVIPDCPHHVTQRGNNRAAVFFQDADYLRYLALLAESAARYRVRVYGYCLMPNHVHLVLTPPEEQALARAVGRAHYRYTLYVNEKYERSGHLWQNRFYSCALDGEHYWTALRYLERNPVRAQMVTSATAYRWSSATAHLGGEDATGLLDLHAWQGDMPAATWQELLWSAEEEAELLRVRTTTHTGRPLGSQAFITHYETLLGRRLQPLMRGRPRKNR